MKFRPCIDIHNGKVKQLVGGSLTDAGNQARENFVAENPAEYYADRYRRDGLTGGHIILLNPVGSTYYDADLEQARRALSAYPGGMQIGGGVRAENAANYLDLGASHVIVTSYVFSDGRVHYDNLERLVREVGKEHIVLDLSCRKVLTGEGQAEYRIVTDRWQKMTQVAVNGKTLEELSGYCDEFLIHAVDVEGTCSGIEQELATLLGKYPIRPMTYAGGVAGLQDIKLLYKLGSGNLDVTVGSALDLFGGNLPYEDVLKEIKGFEREES